MVDILRLTLLYLPGRGSARAITTAITGFVLLAALAPPLALSSQFMNVAVFKGVLRLNPVSIPIIESAVATVPLSKGAPFFTALAVAGFASVVLCTFLGLMLGRAGPPRYQLSMVLT